MRANDSLTPLRGVAACCVVLFHFSIFAPNIGCNHWLPFLNRSHLWVDFFFMLSGYVMMLVYGATFDSISLSSIGQYYWNRLARIYPLHLAVLLTLIGLEFAASAFGQSESEPFSLRSRSFESIWTNLLLIQSWHLHEGNTWNIPSWSISCEWAVYLLFPFTVVHLEKLKTKHIWSILFVSVVLLTGLERWYGALSMSYDWGILRCLGSFIAGAALFELVKPHSSTDFGSSIAYLAALCLPFVTLTAVNRLNMEWPAIPAFLTLLAVMSKARCRLRHYMLENNLMFFLGELSYAIYISHWIVQATVPPVFSRFFAGRESSAEPGQAEMILLVTMIACTLAISCILHNVVEKPARSWLRRAQLHRDSD